MICQSVQDKGGIIRSTTLWSCTMNDAMLTAERLKMRMITLTVGGMMKECVNNSVKVNEYALIRF